jgi:hypothetical protein
MVAYFFRRTLDQMLLLCAEGQDDETRLIFQNQQVNSGIISLLFLAYFSYSFCRNCHAKAGRHRKNFVFEIKGNILVDGCISQMNKAGATIILSPLISVYHPKASRETCWRFKKS